MAPDTPDPATQAAEQRDAAASGSADRPPTPEEERSAEEAARDVPDEAGEHYKEMTEIGAEVKGEGAIEG